MSNEWVNVSDILSSAECEDCGDVIWTEPGKRRVVMCICGNVAIGPTGVDSRSPNQNPRTPTPAKLQPILDFEYGAVFGLELADENADPQKAAREAWERRSRNDGRP